MITTINEFKKSLNEGKKSDKQYKKQVALYKFFIVNTETKKVESGWEFNNDAKDALSDFDGDKKYKIVSELQLKKMGIDNPKQKWINESNEARAMSLRIPEKKDWIEMGENLGIKYIGKTYWIKPNDKKFFEDNIGNDIKFKYLSSSMYMEFPTLLKQNIVTNESLTDERKLEILNDIKSYSGGYEPREMTWEYDEDPENSLIMFVDEYIQDDERDEVIDWLESIM